MANCETSPKQVSPPVLSLPETPLTAAFTFWLTRVIGSPSRRHRSKSRKIKKTLTNLLIVTFFQPGRRPASQVRIVASALSTRECSFHRIRLWCWRRESSHRRRRGTAAGRAISKESVPDGAGAVNLPRATTDAIYSADLRHPDSGFRESARNPVRKLLQLTKDFQIPKLRMREQNRNGLSTPGTRRLSSTPA